MMWKYVSLDQLYREWGKRRPDFFLKKEARWKNNVLKVNIFARKWMPGKCQLYIKTLNTPDMYCLYT